MSDELTPAVPASESLFADVLSSGVLRHREPLPVENFQFRSDPPLLDSAVCRRARLNRLKFLQHRRNFELPSDASLNETTSAQSDSPPALEQMDHVYSPSARPGQFQSATSAQGHMSGGRKIERGKRKNNFRVMRKVFDQLALYALRCQLAAAKAGYTCSFSWAFQMIYFVLLLHTS